MYAKIQRRKAPSAVAAGTGRICQDGPRVKTNKDNPLLIEGYSIFGEFRNEATIHNGICELVRESMESTGSPLTVKAVFQIGRIVSMAQKKRIVLPVETEAILEKDLTNIQFIPEISMSSLDALYMNVFTSKANDSKLVPGEDFVEIEIISSLNMVLGNSKSEKLEGFHHSTIYRVPYDCEEGMKLGKLKKWMCNNLDSLMVYRPQSHYHYRVQTFSMLPSDEASEESDPGLILKIIFRHVRTYKTSIIGDFKCVDWQLDIVNQWDVAPNGDLLRLSIEKMMTVFTQTFITSKGSSAVLECIDAETVDETNRKWIQLTTKGTQLCRQFKRLMECKPNRFGYIISMFEANVRTLLDVFDLNSPEAGNVVDYYPNKFGDTSEYAQIHYDTRRLVRQQGSAIESLRRCNNMVKRIMVAVHVKPNSTILDLACGHAQDLDKYATTRIRKLVGIDISHREIMEARRRYSSRRKSFRFSAEFHHGNLLDNKVYSTYVKNQRFDVASIQLAIHYVLQDEQSCTLLLQNIHRLLNEKGLFIGSTICCNSIAKGLLSSSPYQSTDDPGSLKWQFGNSIFRITLDSESTRSVLGGEANVNDIDSSRISKNLETVWGIKYHFFLMESIDESEYVVPWKSFVDLCYRVGFRLVETCSFPEYLKMAHHSFSNFTSGLVPSVVDNVLNHLRLISSYPLSKDQSQAFSLYKIFVFEKITGRDRMYMQGVKTKR